MVIDNKLELNQIVYLKTDKDQNPRIITQITACANGGIRYCLQCGTQDSHHYESELSDTKDVLITTTN